MKEPQSSSRQTGMPGESRTELLATLEESRGAIDRLISNAQSSLQIFERDLGDPGYQTPQRIESIEQFLRRRQGNRMLLVLHETRYLERDAARLLAMYRRFTDKIEIHQTVDAAKVATDCLVLVDGANYWHRLHQDLPRAVVGYNDSTGARPLQQRFAEIWEASELAAPATTLGL
jgi:hypothetical protein